MTLLHDAHEIYRSWPAHYLLVGHCLLVSSWFREPWRNRFLLCYWVGLIAAFGGGMASSILLQKPEKAANAVFADNKIGLIWTACWWLMTYCPGDVPYKVFRLPPFRIAAKVCLNVLRAGLIASRVDVTLELYPGVVLAPLVIGTIAGSGGKLISDGVAMASGHLTGPAEVTQPGFSAWSGFLGTLLYYQSSHVLGILSREEAKALVISCFVLHGLLVDLTGQPIDYTYPIARMIHGITMIPMPGLQQPPPLAGKQTSATKRLTGGQTKTSNELKKAR